MFHTVMMLYAVKQLVKLHLEFNYCCLGYPCYQFSMLIMFFELYCCLTWEQILTAVNIINEELEL
jgi:hypothetical protein